jgi:serine/threonine protein kinase
MREGIKLPDGDPFATAYPALPASETHPVRGTPGTRPKWLEFLAPPVEPGELGRLGPFRILEVLGTGGMGVVFRAEDTHLQRQVAVKTLLPNLAGSAEAKQRFLREARAAAALRDDHIVAIYQVGEDGGIPYLAMELLEGESLADRLQRHGKLPFAEVLHLGREAARALSAAHDSGLIHRDIKPANIFLETRPAAAAARVKLLDFGLAWAKEREARLTEHGMIIGTPAYMAPEQTQGLEVDYRCDLFSLGCVLYRAATGHRPFERADAVSTLQAIAEETPPPPHELDRALPAAFSDLVMALLAKAPANRVASASALAEALADLQREAALLVPADLPPEATWLDKMRAADASSLDLPVDQLVTHLLPAAETPGSEKDRDLALHAFRHPAAESALPALLQLIKTGEAPFQRLAGACLRLVGPAEAEAADFLVGKLQDAHKEVRTWAISCLQQIGPTSEASVPLLIRALDDEDDAIRTWAIASLARIGPAAEPAVERLLTALKGTPAETRVQAIDALAAIGGNPSLIVPRLVQALKHKDPMVRASAATALGSFRSAAPQFQTSLIAALKDPNHRVRASALSSLRQIRATLRPRPTSITVGCTCGKRLRIPRAFSGKRVHCPSCGRRAAVPRSAAEARPEA